MEEQLPEENNDILFNLIYRDIIDKKIVTKNNILLEKVENETLNISIYLKEKIKQFPKLIDKDLLYLIDTVKFLEKKGIKNNCACTENTDDIPGWKCRDCSNNENSLYCSKCFLKFKDFHKDHKVYFMPYSGGMCDCGNKNNLKNFCPEHKGPYTEQKQIDDFIEKSFSPDVLEKLKKYLDDLFFQFSKYLVLTEQCVFFCKEILSIKFKNEDERNDIVILCDNFIIVFQNFLNFLTVISQSNMGILYLISNYLLKNYFSLQKIEEKDMTSHSCIKIENKTIEIIYEDKNSNKDIFSLNYSNSQEKHVCQCPFLRLLLSNWRGDIVREENDNLLFSLTHNIFIKQYFTILYYFLYKDILFNNNVHIFSSRTKYITEESVQNLDKQSNFIENSYQIFYEYFKGLINNPIAKDINGNFYPFVMSEIFEKFEQISFDINFYTKPSIRYIIGNKTCFIKIFIDIACLMHNKLSFKSIYPHPEFQEKGFSPHLANCEIVSGLIGGLLGICYNFDNFDNTKEIFDYFVKKILNQKNAEIQQLEENEFSFHLTLYRFYASFLNIFIMKYSLKNNKTIIDSMEYIKTKLFNSKEEIEQIKEIIFHDYSKFFAFISGIKNESFLYYDGLRNYNKIYFKDSRLLFFDFILLKYLLIFSEKKLNINFIFKATNLENSYSLFNNFFKIEDKNIIENEEMSHDDDVNKIVSHWSYILELIIIIMKNDSSSFYMILYFYQVMLSLETKKEFFSWVKKNENMMKDIKNMLQLNIVQIFIANGNCINNVNIKVYIDEFFYEIFGEKEINEILEKMTLKKIEKELQILSLKDSYLNNLDLNYYYSYFKKSKAQLFLNDFKKDKFKFFNSYYYKSSELIFDFKNIIYGKILLNIDNIEFIIKLLKIIINSLIDGNKSDLLNRIKNLFFPVVLNFFTIFGTINSKEFIKFKINNKVIINEINYLLKRALENNNNKTLFDDDLSENIKNTINHLNIYQSIFNSINGDLNKLKDHDFYTDFLSEQKQLYNSNSKNIEINSNTNINKSKNIKDKYKNLMKKKRNDFLEKIKDDKNIKNIIQNEDQIGDDESNADNIICFCCRNKINLKSFDEPYGKLGLISDDFLYKNSFRSSVMKELKNIKKGDNEQKNNVYLNIEINNYEKDLSSRIISCGHYFHQKCFKEGLIDNLFKCPLCENFGNILIPPLINFYDNKLFFNSESFNEIINNKITNSTYENYTEIAKFREIIISFIFPNIIKDINIEVEQQLNYDSIIDPLFLKFDSYINYLSNLYYCEATTFHKQQQIEIIKNLILSLRFLTKINIIDSNQIINYIKIELEALIKGPNQNDNIIEKYTNMYYSKVIDKLMISFMILLNNDEIKNLILYAINWSLPYFIFWLYLRDLIAENDCFSLCDEKNKENINLDNFKKFIDKNNNVINEYFKLYLHKMLFFKLIFAYKNQINDLYDNIHTLSLKKLFIKLNIEYIYKSLPKKENNDIDFIHLFEKSHEFLSLDNQKIMIDNTNIINLLINNIIKFKEEKYLMKAELFLQFILYKLDLIELNDNIFDWIENNLFKKCDKCKNYSRHSVICLICGKKLCNIPQACDAIREHSVKCSGENNIFIENQDMRLSCLKPFYVKIENNIGKIIGFKKFYCLYTDDSGAGPNREISNNLKLNKENLKLALKNYVCFDFR